MLKRRKECGSSTMCLCVTHITRPAPSSYRSLVGRVVRDIVKRNLRFQLPVSTPYMGRFACASSVRIEQTMLSHKS